MSTEAKSEQIKEFSGQDMPTWAVTLLADMRRHKGQAQARPKFSTELRAAASRARGRQQTKGLGSGYGARKFTGAW